MNHERKFEWRTLVGHPVAGPILRRGLAALLGAALALLSDAGLLDGALVEALQRVL